MDKFLPLELILRTDLAAAGIGFAKKNAAFCSENLHPGIKSVPNALRAADDARFTMIVSVSSMAAFRIGLSLVLAMQLNYGAIGVFAAMVVDWLFRSVVFFLRYRSGRWWPSRAVT